MSIFSKPFAVAAALLAVPCAGASRRGGAQFRDAKNVEAFTATRKRSDADAKFCWK